MTGGLDGFNGGGGGGGGLWGAASSLDEEDRDSKADFGGGGGVLGLDGAEVSWEPETRTITQMSCSIQEVLVDDAAEEEEEGEEREPEHPGREKLWQLTLLFRLSDKMNRQLTATIG